MTGHRNTDDGIHVRRATVNGYLLFLVGVYLFANNLEGWLSGDPLLSVLSGAVLGAFAVASAVLMAVNPDTVSGGTDTAPRYVVLLALAATVATVLSLALLFV